MPDRPTSAETYPRHAEARVREALVDTRIVSVVGPRQSGKTTLSKKIADDEGMSFVTLDDDQYLEFATADPSGFIRDLDRAVIDEVQRAPGLILALKKTVDDDPRPGRFLITGSVDLFRSSISPDSLAGRIETIELLPFSQAEIERQAQSRFLIRAFGGDFPALEETGRTPDLSERITAGGYPEALARTSQARRRAWLTAYARSLAERDAVEIADISKTAELSRLLDHAAVVSGQLVNLTSLASSLSVDSKTIDRWLTLLEQMFVLRRIRAWHRNDLKRLVKTPKLHFLDTGLLTALRGLDVAAIKNDRNKLGFLLEGFVFSELTKLAGQAESPVALSHYRDKDKVEVDFVLEQAGCVIGIEVKAGATVRTDDFAGLKRLQDAVGSPFSCGILLHDGDRIQRMGDKLFAMPISQVWGASGED